VPWPLPARADGRVVRGGDYALCVRAHAGVIVDAARAGDDQLLVDPFGPPAACKRVD
jgi:hypothetical protein